MATGKSGSRKKADQASAIPKVVKPHQRVNVQVVQNVLLIWLDGNNDDNNEDCRNTVTQLRRVVNDIEMYTDGDECIEFVSTIINSKVCMIISGALGQHIVPHVHNMSQVDSIFIFCGNKKRHAQWANEWPKIKGVFTEITPICEILKKTAQQCEKNDISMSFVDTTDSNTSSKTVDRLDSSFMYTQILKEILLTIEFEENHMNEFIDYCREQFAENDVELENIKKLETKYHAQTPVWWYTYDCFLYPMLNNALRLMDVNIIIRMGFFIGDLHRQIEELHSEQFGDHSTIEKFTVYRGQGLSKEHFEKLIKTKGGLVSFNNFLSTSQDRNISLAFADTAAQNPDLVGVLFIMKIDPSKSTTPFAFINDVSYFQGEDEVLFSMHTVFRINDIKQMNDNNRVYRVKLTLTSDDDQDLHTLTDLIREESSSDSEEWKRLGAVLLKMGQTDKAEQIYEDLLGQTANKSEKGTIYHQLGKVRFNQGKYEAAITLYEKAIEIYKKKLPENNLILAKAYLDIGSAYDSMGNYAKALPSQEKALKIRQQSLPPNHPDLAATYNNIGLVYNCMGEYAKALSYYEKDLKISQQSLPSNHPSIGLSYKNIGNAHIGLRDYPKALSYHEKDLAIGLQSLPPNHPDLAASYNNIGSVYTKMGDYPKALSFHEKALEIQQEALPPNHPDMISTYKNIGNVYYSMGDYLTAFSYYEKDLEISKRSLPPTHSNLASSYYSIGLLYENTGNSSKARSYYEQAVTIGQQSLAPNHPRLLSWRKTLELMKKKS